MKITDRKLVFSNKLEAWLKSANQKTLHDLDAVFKERGFAITILLLMSIPALPLPTGGATHVFEIITALLALEMIAGFKTIWLPQRWRHMKLGKVMENRVLPVVLRRIRWFERHSSSRWTGIFKNSFIARVLGIVILFFTAVAFLSPPFSGLDTLPSLGVVLICLAMILEDSVVLLAGILVGATGTILSIGFGSLIVNLVKRIF